MTAHVLFSCRLPQVWGVLGGSEFVQPKLMNERWIIVDENDKPLGALDMKTSSSTFLIDTNSCLSLMENIKKGLLYRTFSAFPDIWANTFFSCLLDGFEEEKVEEGQHGVKSPLIASSNMRWEFCSIRHLLTRCSILQRCITLLLAMGCGANMRARGSLRGFGILM